MAIPENCDAEELAGPGKDLCERMNFHALEYSMNRVRIFLCKAVGLFERFRFDDNEASCLVGQGTGKDDSTFSIQRLHVCQMCRAVNFPFRLTVGSIESKDHEFHTAIS